MQSPVKKIYITQVFGANPTAYAKFGLKGHNGVDMRAFLPNGDRAYSGGVSEVFAPHGGKIIENALDPQGYGWYIKIEDDKQGSVLAHFSSQSPHKVGATVKQGELVGYQGTTGNSTGIHLHWGWYPIPRDRNNGYNGYEDQNNKYTPYQEGNMSETIQVEKAVFENLVTKSTAYDKIIADGYVTKADHDKRVDELNAQNNSHINEITALQKENAELKQDLEDSEAQDPGIEPVGWVKNGLTKEVVAGNTTWITNYKRA